MEALAGDAEEVLALVGGASKLVHMPLPADDPKQRKPDITRARELLRFDPKVALKEGLQRTIEDFRTRLEERRG